VGSITNLTKTSKKATSDDMKAHKATTTK